MNNKQIHCIMCDNSISIREINNSLPDVTTYIDLNVEQYRAYMYKEFGWDIEEGLCQECLGY